MEKLILMSIKTKYANQIFNGIKKYEFRRKNIGEKNCNKKIIIYSSEKEKAIIGYIIVEKILVGDINFILDATNNKNNSEIINYFNKCDKCYAFKISHAIKYEKPLTLEEIKKYDKNFVVPQFYRYIKSNEYIYDKLH